MMYVLLDAPRYLFYQLFLLYPLSPNGHWAYPFMDTSTLWVVPWMLGLLALHVISFGACLGCGWVSNGILLPLFPGRLHFS